MSWDLSTAKQILGITDDSQDTQIQLVMDTTLAALEAFLQRNLLFATVTHEEYLEAVRPVLLPRYPIKEILKINGEDLAVPLMIDKKTGKIFHPSLFQELSTDPLTVEYSGGYETLPADLEWAMWEAFQHLWNSADETTNAPEGIGTDPSGAAGEVSRVTIQDFGSVTMDTGASLSGDAARMATQRVLDWGWLNPWASTFQLYRSEYGVGGGLA